ncbi:MAG: iron-containing alcohol dehydrogenase [Hydrogenoanaerobacterium sp.]
MDFNFYLPTKIISGNDCVRESGAVLATLGKRCFIITGKNSAKKSGALDDCIAALTAASIEYEIFDGIGQNPLLSVCEEAGRRAKEYAADFLIGIGGGSPLDATKAVAFFASGKLHGAELFGDIEPVALPFVLIGTTAGTGSEVTPYAVLTVDETGRKRSFNAACGLSYARFVFADPKYTSSLSYEFTVSTALDALCHALEGYFASTATEISGLFARRGTTVLVQALKRLRSADGKEISLDLRELLYYGSLYAGVTINTTGTGFCHPLGYFLTEEYQVPHGQACAVYLPAFLREAREYLPQKYTLLFSQQGYDDVEVIKLIKELTSVKLPRLTVAQLADVAKRCASTGNFLHSPGVFTEEKAMALLKDVYK